MLDYRPDTWDSYIGQEALRERLDIHIESALSRHKPLDHILLVGPPGCGKTSLGRVIATKLGSPFTSFVMPVNKLTFIRVVSTFTGVLMLDELHRAPPREQEQLLTLLEDGYFSLPNGARIKNQGLTIVGATTEAEKVIQPVYDRFPIKPIFDEYSDAEMAQIVQSFAKAADIAVSADEADELGKACGGVPRNAAVLVTMLRDLTLSRTEHPPTMEEVLNTCRISPTGLTQEHRNYLAVLRDAGGVAGVDILTTHLRLPRPILLDLERLLVRQNLITYTKQGRQLAGDGWDMTT